MYKTLHGASKLAKNVLKGSKKCKKTFLVMIPNNINVRTQ